MTAAQAFANIAFINISWQNSVEVSARVILSQQTLADGLFAPVFPQYLANHYVYKGQNCAVISNYF